MNLPKHIPQLDVLRGAAVLAVMLYHAADLGPALHLRPLVHLGYTGVDLFFVLSGFLITGILVQSKDGPGYFKSFYARRALRIWPLYYALLFFTFAMLPLLRPSLGGAIFERSHPWQSFPFFLQNLMANGQGAFDTVRVTWSLAIEEQFYLVWPVIVWLAPRRALKPLALSALFLSVAARWSVLYGLTPPVNIYTNTLTRLDGLALGAFLALWIPEKDSRTVRRAGIAMVAVTLPVALAIAWFESGHWSFYALVSASFAGMLCVGINTPALSHLRFMKYTGKISYGLYLVHVPVFALASASTFPRFLFPHSPVTADAVLFVVSFALCYAVAAASWHFYESKFLRWKSRFEYAIARPAAAHAGAQGARDSHPGEEQPHPLISE